MEYPRRIAMLTRKEAEAAAQAHFDAAILSSLKPVEPAGISEEMVERFKAEFANGRGLLMPSSEFVRRCLRAALNGAVK